MDEIFDSMKHAKTFIHPDDGTEAVVKYQKYEKIDKNEKKRDKYKRRKKEDIVNEKPTNQFVKENRPSLE